MALTRQDSSSQPVGGPAASPLGDLSVGATVFYPGHGVATVARMEERAFGAAKQIFFVLELSRGGKVLLPRDKIEQAGVRELVSTAKARALVEQLKTERAPVAELKTDHAARKARAADHASGLKSGSADRYTEILHELMVRARTDRLSNSEKQVLETARGYFVGEVSAVLGRPAAEVEADLGVVTPP